MTISWKDEVDKRKDDILNELQQLIAIPSVLDESDASVEAPLGKEVKRALEYLLKAGETAGFKSKNTGHIAGHLEMGEGEDLLGILCHVDVVPAGNGWTFPPFEGAIKDGRLYGRGAIDDKGPTIAAYYAMKIIHELDLKLNKRVRMIIGTDEESDWRCVDHYFKEEEMPTIGFAPDADFPVIHAEKGIMDADFHLTHFEADEHAPKIEMHTFHAGERYNMVPDYAKAELTVHAEQTYLLQEYEEFLKEQELDGDFYVKSGLLTMELHGKSAHAMEPDNGINAGILLLRFLKRFELDARARTFATFADKYLYNGSRGIALGIAGQDEISGDLTLNTGLIRYGEQNAFFGINIRYPVTYDMDQKRDWLMKEMSNHHIRIDVKDDSKPHHVDGDDPFVQTLLSVYENQTGEKGELLAIGGGTYARSLEKGVAFGALFPGREDVAHQKDEYIEIEDLLKATAIYAEAIYQLACEQ
ncbi:dipeptidase PepV [Jeotgalibacillus haloalkalitolerans]|uniref:Dipeptidase PepV n=1 Tax=Jeotgalibacillus haloalkalitolerans TaxID=3104292 RepID=A0ABU5KN08_9BACL|nr:dipeptidase PepV [Jeotgalibacillus sp. HH7-29]MDZ5712529.1 dipeptidase PepV [Jeotgalibacillus sp. HH7-29]